VKAHDDTQPGDPRNYERGDFDAMQLWNNSSLLLGHDDYPDEET
jgi:hypothetical protein